MNRSSVKFSENETLLQITLPRKVLKVNLDEAFKFHFRKVPFFKKN